MSATGLASIGEMGGITGSCTSPLSPTPRQPAAVTLASRSRVFGMGCFWGAEKMFWKIPSVYSTSVGYAGGYTPNPTYEETCTGMTGHTEAVQVVYDPAVVSYEQLLKVFWENHDPTQGNRQGNDVGTQYRSAIYTTTPPRTITSSIF